jgi:hypothetical protein
MRQVIIQILGVRLIYGRIKIGIDTYISIYVCIHYMYYITGGRLFQLFCRSVSPIVFPDHSNKEEEDLSDIMVLDHVPEKTYFTRHWTYPFFEDIISYPLSRPKKLYNIDLSYITALIGIVKLLSF